MSNIPTIVGGAVSDMLSFFNLGGASLTGAVAQGAVAAFLQKRLATLRDVLIEELEQANISPIEFAHADELGGVLFRFFNAIRDYSATINIRLMAKVMAGQASRHILYADDFSRYASMISLLSQDEIIAITLLHNAKISLGGEKSVKMQWEKMLSVAVPTYFKSEEYIHAVLTAASRSGLVLMSEDIYSVSLYTTSPLLDEVMQLADFHDALRKEGVKMPGD